MNGSRSGTSFTFSTTASAKLSAAGTVLLEWVSLVTAADGVNNVAVTVMPQDQPLLILCRSENPSCFNISNFNCHASVPAVSLGY